MERERSSPQDWREWRRMRAWDLSQHDWAQCDIAEVAVHSAKVVFPCSAGLAKNRLWP